MYLLSLLIALISYFCLTLTDPKLWDGSVYLYAQFTQKYVFRSLFNYSCVSFKIYMLLFCGTHTKKYLYIYIYINST